MGFEEDWQDLVPGADRIPGIGVAVGRLDGDVWTAGHDLLFPACSISKHAAALGTLRLVADVRLNTWQLVPHGRQMLSCASRQPCSVNSSRRAR